MYLSRDLSQNSKTGRVLTSTLPVSTCPSSCPLKDQGCYALSGGPVTLHVMRLAQKSHGLTSDEILWAESEEIIFRAGEIYGVPIRLHVAGDVTTDEQALMLSDAAGYWLNHCGGPIWTYTHSWRDVAPKSWGKISCLASCETISQALQARDRGYRPSLIIGSAEECPPGFKICPAQTREGVTCVNCRLCWRGSRPIAFLAHGARKKRVIETIAKG